MGAAKYINRQNIRPFLLCILLLTGCASNVSGPVQRSGLVPSRAFSGPANFPPTEFAGYGLFAFPADPRSNPARFLMFCKAFATELVSVEENLQAGIPKNRQMATFMPLNSQEKAQQAERAPIDHSCKIAAENYGLAQAQQAIRDANLAAKTDGLGQLTGRGPFLLAWSPGAEKGKKDAIVLAADLSNVESKEQAQDDLSRWRDDIQQNKDLWRRGWNLVILKTEVRRWIDGNTVTILKVLGSKIGA